MASNTATISQQLGALGQALPVAVKRRYDQGFKDMCLVAAGNLQKAIKDQVFNRQAEPSGKPWKKIAPLSVKVRKELGTGGGSRLGGKTLPDSFKLKARGNVFRVDAKTGFTFGSKLKAKNHLVAATFASDFKMPRTAATRKGSRATARKIKTARQKMNDKGARIRGFMLAVAGVGAPAPGKQLHHPARKIVYWTPAWERLVGKAVEGGLARAFAKAKGDAGQAVAARGGVAGAVSSAQTGLASIHRTSVVG